MSDRKCRRWRKQSVQMGRKICVCLSRCDQVGSTSSASATSRNCHLCARKGFKRAVGKTPSAQKPHFRAWKAWKVPFGRSKARKKCCFALRKPENACREALPRTKSLFLSLKSPKTWQKLPKKGQNGHFCAQKPLKRRFWRAKKDKNSSFVLGKAKKTVPAIHLPHL